MSRFAIVRRMLLVALALAGTGGIVAACTDGPSGPDHATVQAGGPSLTVTTVGGGGEDGEGCDVYLDATCNPDPCFYGSDTPGCDTDPCSMNPSDPSCTDPCDADPTMCWGGGGDGGGTAYEPSSELEICPSRDPGCLKELSATQKQAIGNALNTMKTQFSDPNVANICNQLKSEATALLNGNMIFAGSRAIPDSPQGEDHTAEYDPQSGKLHVDEAWLNQAISGGYNQSLGSIILHETAHKLNYTHPVNEGFPYTTYPFNHTSYTYPPSGPEKCF